MMKNPPKRIIISILVFAALVVLLVTGKNIHSKKIDEDIYERLISIHQVKKAPGPYDWLTHHPEPGQTFSDYINGNTNRPDERRKYIYVALLGDFDAKRKEIIDKTSEYISKYYGLGVKYTGPISLSIIPANARRVHPKTKDKQVLSTYVIDKVLRPILPDDGFCLIAFTTSDLWPGQGWNFVFGQASIEDRVGVWSIYRNGDPNKSGKESRLCLRRTMSTGVHEIGHMFSMHHCIYFECMMNGSNHRMESDSRPLHLCPVCLRKLIWNTDVLVQRRYKELMKFYDRYGFNEDKLFIKRSLKAMDGK